MYGFDDDDDDDWIEWYGVIDVGYDYEIVLYVVFGIRNFVSFELLFVLLFEVFVEYGGCGVFFCR